MRNHQQNQDESETTDSIHKVRLPGFLVEEEIGLGDVIKRATSALGLTPCEGCQRRAMKLNQWMSFVGRK